MRPHNMGWLIAAGLSCALFAAVVSGTFVPLRDSAGIHYLFAAAPLDSYLACAGIALAALGAVLLIARRSAPHGRDPRWRAAWLAPMGTLGFAALGITPAIRGVGDRAAPAAYFFHDLRWWWCAGLMVCVVIALARARGSRLHFDCLVKRPGVDRFAVLALVVAWAVVSTPHLRFSGVLHGDEPKYLRYGEVWFQGGGLAIDGKVPYSADMSRRAPDVIGTAGALLRGIADESAALRRDVAAFLRDPTGFRWHRAAGADGFVTGKSGGVYQIHNPGVSAVLYPAYVIDRALVRSDPGETGEFPSRLPATNAAMLLIYGACALALLALLRDALGSQQLAWLWTALAMLTLPTTAFAFQLYPELPALLVILLLTRFVLFDTSDTSGRVLSAGAAAAALLWMHPRFLLVSLVLGFAALVRLRGTARLRFASAFALVLLSVLAFEYRVTGSWLPSARWAAIEGGQTLHLWSVPLNLLGYAVDRTWGVLPHTPILILAIPGMILLARDSWPRAGLLMALGLALAVPAAGHSLSAAGGTPGRLVLAVVPLAFWPLAVAVTRTWHSASARALTIVLAVVSLETALAYNLHHVKRFGPLRAPGSGWRLNLAFPEIRGDTLTAPENLAVLIGVALILAAVAWFILRSARQAPSAGAVEESRSANAFGRVAWRLAVVLGATISLASAAAAATGHWTDHDFLPEPRVAVEFAAAALVAPDRCVVCSSSRTGPTDWTRLEPNAADAVTADVQVESFTATIHVRLDPAGGAPRFGRVSVDFGDGSSTGWSGIVGERTFVRRYAKPGRYTIVARVRARGGGPRAHDVEVVVR